MRDRNLMSGRVLTIYVSQDCPMCRIARDDLERRRREATHVQVEIVDIADAPAVDVPAFVFSVPTYVLDGRVISLGNPSPEILDGILFSD